MNAFKAVALCAGLLAVTAPSARALPFNQDMSYGQNMPTGSIMRPSVPNTVPLGSLERRIENRDEVANWENPQKGDAVSTANGQRLFAINCSPCHGSYEGGTGTYAAGAVSAMMPGPELSGGEIAKKTDGHFFQYIHFGGVALMPAYGWKLSISEHWDIVNYIRKVQSAKAGQ